MILLPPSDPEFIPIDDVFSKLKAIMRDVAALQWRCFVRRNVDVGPS
jgi:hypothetical protein